MSIFGLAEIVYIKDTDVMITKLYRTLSAKFENRTGLKVLFSAVALITVVACGNSKILLGPLYNRLDNQMRKEFNKLGNFTKEQKSDFEQRLQTYHLWHRRQQLPRYAALIDEVVSVITEEGATTDVDIRRWFASVEGYSINARSCHPVNYSFDFMKSLTDKQVNFIEARFANEQKKNQTRYNSRTREERLQRRYSFILKWTGRAGFKFTDEQKTMLKTALGKQISLRKQYWALSGQWNKDFFVLARKQQFLDYDSRMETQLNKLWNLLEDNETQSWAANRQLWNVFFLDFVNSTTPSQRKWVDGWASKLARTLRDMSNDSVKFESTRGEINPSLGCV